MKFEIIYDSEIGLYSLKVDDEIVLECMEKQEITCMSFDEILSLMEEVGA